MYRAVKPVLPLQTVTRKYRPKRPLILQGALGLLANKPRLFFCFVLAWSIN